jgi:hypothetical protein
MSVKKREVAVPPRFHGELNIPVKTILVVKKPPQLLWFVLPGDKSIINIRYQHSSVWVTCAKVLSSKFSIKKLAISRHAQKCPVMVCIRN